MQEIFAHCQGAFALIHHHQLINKKYFFIFDFDFCKCKGGWKEKRAWAHQKALFSIKKKPFC